MAVHGSGTEFIIPFYELSTGLKFVDLLKHLFPLTPIEQQSFAQQLATVENLATLNEIINGLLSKEITLPDAQALIAYHVQQGQKTKSKEAEAEHSRNQ